MSDDGPTIDAPASAQRGRERRVTAIAAAAQLVVILDLTLMLPLAPDLVGPLAIAPSALGALLAIYAAAAALSGLMLAPLLDRFARRRALQLALLGLTLASASTSLATSFVSLLALRGLAGLLAAPTSALLMALITDEVPVARRGRALGRVLGANALAGVLGVPAALWLAGRLGWWAGYAFIGALGAGISVAIVLLVRGAPLHAARASSPARPALPAAVPLRLRLLSHLLLGLAFAAVVPMTANMSAYVQLNLGFPRAELPPLYAAGAALTLVVMAATGAAVDRFSARLLGCAALALLAGDIAAFLLSDASWLSLELAFVLMLACIGSRNVSIRTLTSRVPDEHTRARFMARQAASRQLGAVAGALLGVSLLDERGDGQLVGMPTLALACLALLALLPPLLVFVELRLDRRT